MSCLSDIYFAQICRFLALDALDFFERGFLENSLQYICICLCMCMCSRALKRVYICGCYNNNGFKCDCHCGHSKYVSPHTYAPKQHSKMRSDQRCVWVTKANSVKPRQCARERAAKRIKAGIWKGAPWKAWKDMHPFFWTKGNWTFFPLK